MESSWLTHAKRLQAIASTGLHFCRDVHDRERYQEVADIAHDMLAQLGNVPLERINELVSDFAQRYSTPMVEVRGALIEDGKITAPVKGATLIGNGPEAMSRVSMVGNDLSLDSGVGTCGKDGQSVPVGVGQPTLKIDAITVGGTGA